MVSSLTFKTLGLIFFFLFSSITHDGADLSGTISFTRGPLCISREDRPRLILATITVISSGFPPTKFV